MTTEPIELTRARALLGKFEAEMQRPEAVAYLTEGLSLLSDIRADAARQHIAEIASNLALAYARMVQQEVESLLSSELSIHLETLDHWHRVFAEFEQFGFTLPPEIAETRSNVQWKKAEKAIELLSPSERKELLKKLQAGNT